MILRLALLVPLAALSACSFHPSEVGQEPHLTAVGSGLVQHTMPINAAPSPVPVYRPGNSLWQDASADFFHDPRASQIGDLVTVRISIQDKAKLENDTKRQRQSDGKLDAEFSYSLNTAAKNKHLQASGDGSFKPSVTAETKTDAQSNIDRSETINLLVAAIVTKVLPNGNLMISGTQEVRVNFEVRVLHVEGIVRPRDIMTDNSVSYEKVAEARISYGGRGRNTEIQQPGWGQQIIDAVSPY